MWAQHAFSSAFVRKNVYVYLSWLKTLSACESEFSADNVQHKRVVSTLCTSSFKHVSFRTYKCNQKPTVQILYISIIRIYWVLYFSKNILNYFPFYAIKLKNIKTLIHYIPLLQVNLLYSDQTYVLRKNIFWMEYHKNANSFCDNGSVYHRGTDRQKYSRKRTSEFCRLWSESKTIQKAQSRANQNKQARLLIKKRYCLIKDDIT